MKMIEATINGNKIKLRPYAFEKVPPETVAPYRLINSGMVKPVPPCDWPFKKMEDGQCITIRYGLASPRQVKTALREYCKHKKSVFEYRRTAKGLKIFCLKQKSD